ALRRPLNPAFLISASRWRGRPHFPHQGSSMLRVRGEEPMQHTGPTPRQSHDEKRFTDFLTRNVWIKLPVPFHFQTRTQCLQDVDLQSNFSDQVEVCLILGGLEKARQRFKKIAITKMIEAAASLCSVDQVPRNHWGRSNSRLFQQRAKSIEKSDR